MAESNKFAISICFKYNDVPTHPLVSFHDSYYLLFIHVCICFAYNTYVSTMDFEYGISCS